jgi:hypothetical protein
VTDQLDLSRVVWRKASFSQGPTSNCVEVALAGTSAMAVRDSKDPGGAVLSFELSEWRAFVSVLRANRLS